MSPAMILLRRQLSSDITDTNYRDTDVKLWALVEIAYQLDRIADSLANMEHDESRDSPTES